MSNNIFHRKRLVSFIINLWFLLIFFGFLLSFFDMLVRIWLFLYLLFLLRISGFFLFYIFFLYFFIFFPDVLILLLLLLLILGMRKLLLLLELAVMADDRNGMSKHLFIIDQEKCIEKLFSNVFKGLEQLHFFYRRLIYRI